MIKKVLWSLLAFLIVVLVVAWIWTGGLGRVLAAAKSLTNIVDFIFYNGTSTRASLRLPWQPEFLTDDSFAQLARQAYGPSTEQDELSSLTSEYEKLDSQITESKTFGDPSPLKGQVRIINEGDAKETSAPAEYIEIGAGVRNTAPIDINGWSLQSAYTGIRAYIPQGASPFVMGVVNNMNPIQLAPGQSAVVNSGVSPVGVSFRENACSGYLGQLQVFAPPLSNSCPSPASELPLTPDNLRTYGEACFDFLQTIPVCKAPLNNVPPNVSSNCRYLAADALSYNGCVAKNRSRASFAEDSWRIYLNSGTELWRNSHDIIRLLDADGRTVDVLTY